MTKRKIFQFQKPSLVVISQFHAAISKSICQTIWDAQNSG